MNAKPTPGQPGQHDAVDDAVELPPPEQQHEQHRRALRGLLDPRRDEHRGRRPCPLAAAGARDRDQARGVEHRRGQRGHGGAPEEREEQQAARLRLVAVEPASAADDDRQRQQRPATRPIRKPTTPVSCVTAPSTSSPQAAHDQRRGTRRAAPGGRAAQSVGRSHRTSLATAAACAGMLLAAVIGVTRASWAPLKSGWGPAHGRGRRPPSLLSLYAGRSPPIAWLGHGDPPCRRSPPASTLPASPS